MARKQKKIAEVGKTINSLTYSAKKSVDRELISKVNSYSSLPQNEGISPIALIRNFLIRKLTEAIELANRKQAS